MMSGPPQREIKLFPLYTHRYALAIVLALAIGLLLRTIKFGQLPPGLWHDEVWNGMDAVQTLQGDWQIFYPNNTGREPLQIWLAALSIKALGRTPAAIRLPSLLLGFLTLPACYLLARELLGPRVALWALAIMAFTFWPVHQSRVGFRAVGLPLFTGLALWQIIRGSKTGRARHWLMGGLLYGISFYTYIPARFTPIAMALVLLYLAVTRQLKPTRSLVRGGIAFIAAAALVVLPLAAYAAAHPDIFFLRIEQTSIFNEPKAAQLGNFERLALSAIRTLGIFNIRGDLVARHNLPARPAFDVVMGAAFLIGCGESLRRFRQAQYAFIVIWVTVMLGPNVWSTITPGFLRTIGIWPVLALLPAIGLDQVWQVIRKRGGDWQAILALGIILISSLSITVYDYFVRYPQLEIVRYKFEDAGLQLAHEVNTLLESGWRRGDLTATWTSGNTSRRVIVDRQVWKDWQNARFLVPESRSLIVPGSQSRGGSLEPAPIPTILFAWWHPDHMGFWLSEIGWLPRHSKIEMRQGPLSIRDLLPGIHPAYVVFTATPYITTPTPLAHFEPGVELVGLDVQGVDEQLQIQLEWLASQTIPLDYTIFAHVERAGVITAQYNDGPLGGCRPMIGCLSTTYWRPGDVIADTLELALPEAWDPRQDKIWVGMYHEPELERLPVTSNQLKVSDRRVRVFPVRVFPATTNP